MKRYLSSCILAGLLLSGCSQSPTESTDEIVATAKPAPATDESSQLLTGLANRIRVEGQDVDFNTLEKRMAHFNVPGISVAFMREGEIVWTLQAGVKDKETGNAVDERTVFQAGSISKPAFAAVLMKYRQDSPVDLDTDINSLLNSWQLPSHEWTESESVTLRRLLSHTAGTTVHGFPGYASGEAVPTLQQVLDGAEPANTGAVVVDIAPGSRMRYSGGGTTVAQLTLEDISGEHLTPMAERLMFGPLEMARSGFNQPISEDLSDNMALPYQGDGTPVKGGAHTYATLAAAGMWSTPSDMLRMARAVRNAYHGSDTSWITQATAQEMLTTNAPSADDANVGIGFFIDMDDAESIRGFGHGGADEGFISQLYLELESGNGYAIMTNSNNGGQLISEVEVRIAEAFGVGNNQPITKSIVAMSEEALKGYMGVYKVTQPVTVDVVIEPAENGFFMTASPYVEDERYWHEGEGAFFSLEGGGITFELDESDKVSGLVMSSGIRATKAE